MKEPQIQGLRGLAIAMVAIFHFTVRWGSLATHETSLYPFSDIEWPTFAVLYAGRLGVELFFMISGFVIALTLQRSDSLKEFLSKRFIRLWPPLLLALPLCAAVLAASPPLPASSPSLLALAQSFTLVSPDLLNYLYPSARTIGQTTGVLWTLWVELQFYAIAALIFFGSRRNFTNFLVIFALAAQVFWVLAIAPFSPNLDYNLFSLSRYIWWFVAGAVFYEIWTLGFTARRWVLIITCWFSTAAALSVDQVGTLIIPELVNSAFFALFLILAARRDQTWLRNSGLVWLGNVSYEFYLVHEVVGVSLLQALREANLIPTAFSCLPAFALSALVAFVINKYWSQPVSRLARKFLLKT